MRASVRWFDGWVSRQRGIMTISTEERCILKVELRRASGDLALPGTFLQKGDPILKFHLWNSHLPEITPGRVGLEWAVETWQRFQYSLRLLARQVEYEAAFQGVKAICGVSSLFSLQEKDSGARLMERLGFTVLQNPNPLGLLGKFGENLYSWILLWAYNPASLPSHTFLQLERTGIWMSAATLRDRFGKTETAG